MASLTQGSPLPNITTNQTQATTAPSWYTDYLSNLASSGNQAAAGAQYVGATPLQQQAFNQTAQNVGNYQPNLNAATNLAGNASNLSALGAAQPYINDANQNAYNTVGNYMSPYISDVVNQIGALGQRQIQQNLAPGATAAAVGSGQFGSKRGAEVLGNTIRDANQNILATQGQALNTGYQNAMQTAQTDLARKAQLGQLSGQMTTADMANQLNASQQFGNLANQTQALGLGDVNALATMGGQQQQIEQNQSLFPMQVANQQAALLRGYTIPTSTSSTYTGPIPGAYSASPLSQIAGVGSLLGALSTAGPNGTTAGGNLIGGIVNAGSSLAKLFGSGATPGLGQTTDWLGRVVTDPTYGQGGSALDYANQLGDPGNALGI